MNSRLWLCVNKSSYKFYHKVLLTLDLIFFSFSSDLLSRIDLDELMKKDEPPFTFPKTLEEFEYAFNECKYIF